MWKRSLDDLFRDWNQKHIVTSPDVDGLLCALIVMHHIPESKLLGFYDCNQLTLCAEEHDMELAKDALWVDLDVLGNIRCIGQHLIQYEENDIFPTRHPLSFNPNVFFGQNYKNSFWYGMSGKRDKYPFGTIHLLIDYFNAIITDRAKPFIAHADGSWINAVRYHDNCCIWKELMKLTDSSTWFVDASYTSSRETFVYHYNMVFSLREITRGFMGNTRSNTSTTKNLGEEWKMLEGNQSIDLKNPQSPKETRKWLECLFQTMKWISDETGWNVRMHCSKNTFVVRKALRSILRVSKNNAENQRIFPTPLSHQSLPLFSECDQIFSLAFVDTKTLNYTHHMSSFEISRETEVGEKRQKS